MLFESHDKDQNGKLSWQEFSGQESKNEKAFKLMDADHNGKITKNVSLIFYFYRVYVIVSFIGVQEGLSPSDEGAGEVNHQTQIGVMFFCVGCLLCKLNMFPWLS